MGKAYRKLLDSPAICSSRTVFWREGPGWGKDGSPGKTAQSFSVTQPGWGTRPRQGQGNSRASKTLRGGQQEGQLFGGEFGNDCQN